MKTVLITGVAGFLGRYAAREFLGDGWRVVGIDDVPPENAPRGVEFQRMHLPTSELATLLSNTTPVGPDNVGLENTVPLPLGSKRVRVALDWFATQRLPLWSKANPVG